MNKKVICLECGSEIDETLTICSNCGAPIESSNNTISNDGILKNNEVTSNTLINADRSYEDENYEEAFNLYSQEINLQPDNPHIIVRRALASTWSTKLINYSSKEIVNASKRAFQIKYDSSSIGEYCQFCNKFITEIISVLDVKVKSLVSLEIQSRPQAYDISSAIIFKSLQNECDAKIEYYINDGVNACLCLIEKLLEIIKDDNKIPNAYFDDLTELLKKTVEYRKLYKLATTDKMEEIHHTLKNAMIKIGAVPCEGYDELVPAIDRRTEEEKLEARRQEFQAKVKEKSEKISNKTKDAVEKSKQFMQEKMNQEKIEEYKETAKSGLMGAVKFGKGKMEDIKSKAQEKFKK